MGEAEIRALVDKVAARPDDHELRQQAAEALDAAGQRAEATALLAPLINVTGHDDDAGLPCLCKTCLPTAPAAAESAGMKFKRAFAVTGTRVLHFWNLAELEGERRAVRGSVSRALATRLAAQKGRRR